MRQMRCLFTELIGRIRISLVVYVSDNHRRLFRNRLKLDPDGTRTHNPQLRRLIPYPLGHWVLVIR